MSENKSFLQRFGCVGMATMLLVGGGLGIYAGARWHDAIWNGAERLMQWSSGSSDASSTKKTHQLWTCSMHPQVIRDGPGLCPICHMELTPVEPESPSSMPADSQATTQMQDDDAGHQEHKTLPPVMIDPVTVQNMGVRTTKAAMEPLRSSVRLVAYVDEAQPMEYVVNLRVSGWITRLYASTQGEHIKAGDPLFDLYSPELRVGIQELIAARKLQKPSASDTDGSGVQIAEGLYTAAARKLELMGLGPEQIAEMARLDQPPASVRFSSPISGHLIDKPVIEGAAVQKGERVLRIVDHSTLWVNGQVFEKDLASIKVGQEAQATFPNLSSEPYRGKIVFIHPHIDMATRTAAVRMIISNPELRLRPGMFGSMRVDVGSGESVVQIPTDAILDTGERRLAFVSNGGGRFEPRELIVARRGDNGMVEVVKGIAAGENVVVSGQFLIDSESKLREAIRKFTAQHNAVAETSTTAPGHMDGEEKP